MDGLLSKNHQSFGVMIDVSPRGHHVRSIRLLPGEEPDDPFLENGRDEGLEIILLREKTCQSSENFEIEVFLL